MKVETQDMSVLFLCEKKTCSLSYVLMYFKLYFGVPRTTWWALLHLCMNGSRLGINGNFGDSFPSFIHGIWFSLLRLLHFPPALHLAHLTFRMTFSSNTLFFEKEPNFQWSYNMQYQIDFHIFLVNNSTFISYPRRIPN